MKYPVGIQSFESLRDGGFVYVDKTDIIYNLSFRRIRTANVIVWYKVLNITKIVAKLFGCFDFI